MLAPSDRRDFFKQAAALALGAAGAGLVSERRAGAVPPLGRTRPSLMKLSLAAYSFRDFLQPKKGSTDKAPMTLFDFIDYCADRRLDGTELTSYYFPNPIPEEYFAEIKRRAHLLGLAVSGTAIANVFTLPPGPERQKQIDYVKRWVDYAAAMGAPTIRIYTGSIPAGGTLEQAIAWSVECIEEACAYAGQKGVFLALENHGGISVPAANMLAILEKVKSPWFGINLDTGNFGSKNPYEEMRQVAPYAVTVQMKTEITPKGGRRQPIDMKKVVGILREAKYSGYIALEYEAAEAPKTGVPKALDELRDAIHG
jgi:sugar phosphate isomerase/epimerase